MPGPPKGTPVPEKARATQWKPGQSGNPTGMTKAMAQRIQRNATIAAEAQSAFLEALTSQIETVRVHHGEDVELSSKKIMDLLNPNVNTLVKDAMERGMGKVVQEIRAKIAKSDAVMHLSDEAIIAELQALDDDE